MNILGIFAAAASLAVAAGSNAGVVIDQKQDVTSRFSNYEFGVPTQGWSFRQTFKPAATTLSGAAIRFNLNGLDPSGFDPDEWFSLGVTFDGVPRTPWALDYSIDADGWVSAFWTPFTVVPDLSYTIVFSVFGGSQSPPYTLFVNTEDGYLRGRLTDSFGATGDDDVYRTVADVYSGNGKFDAVFRTYAESVSGAVPEPATWALLISGFGLTGAMLRRRRGEAANLG
jgi:hypothetical protein